MPDPLRPATEAEELSYRIRKANLALAMFTDPDDTVGDCQFTCDECGLRWLLDHLSDQFESKLICTDCSREKCYDLHRDLRSVLVQWEGQNGEGDRLADLLSYAKSLTPPQQPAKPAG